MGGKIMKKFLETYPLYTKYKYDYRQSASSHDNLNAINMYCDNCKSTQTFVLEEHVDIPLKRYQPSDTASTDKNQDTFFLKYTCRLCNDKSVVYVIKQIGKESIIKIGQYPPVSINMENDIQNLLKEKKEYYKKGLICESQGYGIAAFSYYRRIIESVIEELLNEISELIEDEQQVKYKESLSKIKKKKNCTEKIKIVKDLLPDNLHPGNLNPLDIIYSALSAGLHAESDDNCLKYAMEIRYSLVYLVEQINISKKSQKKSQKQ